MKQNWIIALFFVLVIGGVGVLLFSKTGGESVSDLYNYSANEPENGKVAEKPETINNNLDEEKNTKKMTSATLKTNKGDIVIELFADMTPNTVANFTKLASENFYNGVKFHRVIKGFMIQGGDPLTKDDSKMALWGTGGPGYKFADEIKPTNKNDAGTISMANAGPNTNGSQFFINVANNNFLDTKHTVFGKVVSGMEVVKAIESTPTGDGDRPVTAVVINSIEVK